MAIVGTAYIKIQAITTDFKKEADRAYESFFRMVTKGYAIGPALATAVGGISSMVSGLVALTSQIAAALPALIVLPSMFSAIGQAAIAAKMAFSGIGAAMKALTKKGGGGGDNSKRIEQAEKRLAQVLESNREALVRANDRLTEAEERLTKARIEAAESLQQLNFDAEDAAISEKKAAIELEKARETLARVQDLPPNSRARREAELAYQEADLNMRRAKDANSDLAKETEKRNKLGVEGSEEVVDATKQVQEAVDARAKAELEALRALTEAQEALNDSRKGSGGGGADDEALSKLSKEARAFAEYLVSIQPELVKLRHAAGRELFKPMQDALDNIVKNLFPALIPILEKTGAALGKSALDFSNIVTAEDNLKNLNEVASTNTDTIGKLGTIFGNLYDVFLTVLSAADPLIRRFTDWLVVLTTGWKETNEVNKESKTLADTFKYAGDIAAQLGRALGGNGLFGAIMNIGKAASGPGSGGEMLLDTFEKSMKKFDEFTAKMLGDGSLEKFFVDASANFAKISTLAVKLVKEFLKLGDDKAIGETADALGGLPAIIGGIFEVLQEAGPYLASFVDQLAKFLALFAESQSIKMFFGTLETALRILTDIFSQPMVQKVLLFGAAFLGVVKALSVISRVGGFVFKVLIAYVGKALFIVEKLRIGFTLLSTTTGLATGPLLAVIAAVAAVIAIFVLAYQNSEKFREALKDLAEKTIDKVKEAFQGIKDAINDVMSSFGGMKGSGDGLKSTFKAIGDFTAKYLLPVFENMLLPTISAIGHAFKAIIYVIGVVIKVFQGLIEFIRGVFALFRGDTDGAAKHFGNSFKAIAKAFEFAFQAIREIFLVVFDGLKAYFAPFIALFIGGFKMLLATVVGAFKAIWAIVKLVFGWIAAGLKFIVSIFKVTFQTIAMVVTEVWNGVKTAFDIVWNLITAAISIGVDAWNGIFETVGMVFSEVWNGIKIAFDLVWGLITSAISIGVDAWNGIFETVGMVFSTVWQGIKTSFDIVWGLITGAISLGVAIWTGIFETIEIIFSEVWDGIKTAFELVWGGITSAIDGIRSVVLGVKDAIVGAFKTAFNLIADIWNNTVGKLRFRIPSWVPPPLGGKGFDVPLIEKFTGGGGNSRAVTAADVNMYRARLAKGGTVLPTPGGTLAVIGEAGRPERVEPLDPDGLSKRDKAMITLLSGGKGGGITMNVYPSPGMNETELAAKISRELAFQLRRGAA